MKIPAGSNRQQNQRGELRILIMMYQGGGGPAVTESCSLCNLRTHRGSCRTKRPTRMPRCLPHCAECNLGNYSRPHSCKPRGKRLEYWNRFGGSMETALLPPFPAPEADLERFAPGSWLYPVLLVQQNWGFESHLFADGMGVWCHLQKTVHGHIHTPCRRD